jgi:hypothetical protein
MGLLRRTLILAAVVQLTWGVSSCLSPKTVSLRENPPSTAAPESRVKQDESLDPLTLKGEDMLQIPVSPLRTPATNPTDQDETHLKTGSGKVTEEQGFRVQLFASGEEKEARSYEERALLLFNENVYLTFEIPTYKVRLGDCRTRSEANILRQEAENKGFTGAWVVRCRVLLTNP